jgi:hypothetical protein
MSNHRDRLVRLDKPHFLLLSIPSSGQAVTSSHGPDIPRQTLPTISFAIFCVLHPNFYDTKPPMNVLRCERSAFRSRGSLDLGGRSPLESGRTGASPTPRPSRPLRETVKGTGTFASDPLRFLRPLGFLKAFMCCWEARGNHVCQQSQEVQEDQDPLAIDLRHTGQKNHPVSFIRPGS